MFVIGERLSPPGIRTVTCDDGLVARVLEVEVAPVLWDGKRWPLMAAHRPVVPTMGMI